MDLLARSWHDAWVAPDDRQIYEWAAENIDLPVGGYAIPGFFSIEKSRHLIEVFHALHDLDTRIISCCAAIQTGKSMLSDIWLPYTLANRPGPVLLTMQTDQIARDHAEVRLMPVVKASPALKRIYPDASRKSRSQEIIFKNGVPMYVRGPAIGNAQSKSIRYLSIDEAWLLAAEHPGRIREFMARTSKFDEIGNSKTLITSQGSSISRDPEKKIIGDDFAILWHDGSQSFWEIHCTHCRHRFIPRWTIPMGEKNGKDDFAGMKWDDNGGQVRYECPNCRQAMIDTDMTKAEWNAHGRYVSMNPAVTIHKSFQWPAWISGKWEPLVKDFLAAQQAKRSRFLMPLQIFVQKKAAEFWDVKRETDVEECAITVADYTPSKEKSWPEEKYRFMSIDCQADLLLFYVVIRAWSASGESRLYRGRFQDIESIHDLQKEYGIPGKFVGIDCGFEQTRVFRICCRHVEENLRGWTAFKEIDRQTFTHKFKDRSEQRIYSTPETGDPLIGMRNADTQKYLDSVSPHAAKAYKRGVLKARVYLWSRPSVSDILAALRDGKGAPFLAPGMDAGDEEEHLYRRHMAAEAKRLKPNKSGVLVEQWDQLSKSNHYWSCEKINVVMAALAGVVNPDGFANS